MKRDFLVMKKESFPFFRLISDHYDSNSIRKMLEIIHSYANNYQDQQ